MIQRPVASLARLFGIMMVLALGGCSSEDNAWRQYFQLLRQGLGGGLRDHGVTREQAAAIPYASLGFRIDDGHEGILVLATDTDGDLLWTSASHLVLLTRGGRIARSVGLPNDRTAMVSQGVGPLPPLIDALKAPYRSTRIVDMSNIGAYAVSLNCLTFSRGAQAISILGTSLAARRVDETCQSNNPRWSFTDSYWLDAKTGFVWHSIQHLSPAGGAIQIEILRPPG